MVFGVRVRVVPDFIDLPLTWGERLFSWPWRPWVEHRRVENNVVPRGVTLVGNDPADPFNPVLLVRESDYERLRQRLQHHSAYELMHPGEEPIKPPKPH